MIRRRALLRTVLLLLMGCCAPATAATTLTAAGSTALLPLMKAAAAQYSAAHPEVTISVSGGGSGSGIAQVAAGAIDIGDSDIPAPAAAGLHDHRVAVVGSGVIVHSALHVRSLRRSDLAGIFSGRIVNWRELGGPDTIITVVNRPRSSGTRAVFRRTIMQGEQIADSALTVDASGTVVATVATTPGAISYVALSALAHSPLRPIAIDGIEPSKANIVSGRYPLWAYEHLFTGKSDPRLEAFISAVARNRALLTALRYIPLDDMRVVKSDR